VLDFLKLITDKDGALAINRDDEIVAATLLCMGGQVLRK
jgi:NAD(P) transhydrogenase subunit alpha